MPVPTKLKQYVSATTRSEGSGSKRDSALPPRLRGSKKSKARQQAAKKQRKAFQLELNAHLYDFVCRLLPTQDELAIKEDVRRLLEKLIRTIEPDSRLLAFGSTANGFSLRNSGKLPPIWISAVLSTDQVYRQNSAHARIPIVKLSLQPSPGLPFGISCDIGFENRLALENTRLLHTYASVDPARVRTMVLFLKVWCKRRKINSPYEGTLSSYGYVLLVIYFLVHVKSPPVLPNLQQLPHDIEQERERKLGGNNRWQSTNTQSVAELLAEMFRYYARDFNYGSAVASIRAGPLRKATKGWTADLSSRRDGNRVCIEDPFETEYNVGRCVTQEGLFLIRGEFMRASRILGVRHDNALIAIAQLCAERDETTGISSSPSLPPAPPYGVGARPAGANVDAARALSPLPVPIHYAPGGTPGSSVMGSPNPSASPSPSMRDADDFSSGTGPDDDDARSTSDFSALDGDDNASISSMHSPQQMQAGASVPHPAHNTPRQQQQQQPQVWTGAPPPPGFISHHARRSASAGAEPWRMSFPPYHSGATPKPGQSSPVPMRQGFIPGMPQYAQHAAPAAVAGSAYAQQQPAPLVSATWETAGRSHSQASSSRSRSRSRSEDATPRNPNFRVAQQHSMPSGVVLPASAPRPSPTRFAFGSMPPQLASGAAPAQGPENGNGDSPRIQHAQRHSSGPGGFTIEDLARLRADQDATPRAASTSNRAPAARISHASRHSTTAIPRPQIAPLSQLTPSRTNSSNGSGSSSRKEQSQNQPPRIEIVPAAQTVAR
ncbi:hypothetical protein BKA62DRAFT_800574 [Auriculariales sp. MPI-PUGE-AT-0066]|nr:hypothetical protein BKA62DRAFT_800574 [Auriculariales sp. MPI-PUGE-AT-0066]